MLLSSLLGLGITGCGACSSPEDQAAKARIFSPEDPPRVLQAAAEPLDADLLGEGATTLARILEISAQEAQARLGPHMQSARVSFRWTLADREVSLTEDRFVAIGPSGDFHARVENSERQGMEWVRVKGISYARSRYAPFRERRLDRGSSDHVVRSTYATLENLNSLLHGAITVERVGEETLAGRSAIKYALALGEPRAQGAAPLPELQFPKGGPDRDTRLRLEAATKGKPTALSGSLYLDKKSAVPLRADLRAELVVPGEEGEARLELKVTLEVTNPGEDPEIQIPEHIEDAPRPPGVVATLDAYGMARASEEKKDAEVAPSEP